MATIYPSIIAEDTASPRVGAVALVTTVVVLTVAFYLMEHRNAEVSNLEAFTITGEEMVERASEGDFARRVAIPGLAVFGAVLLMRRSNSELRLESPLAWLLVGYAIWAVASVLWSQNMPMTVRHVCVFVLCSIAAMGIARNFAPMELCVIALAVTSLLVLNSVCVEIALGTFRPWAAGYRFAGTLHPNVQAPYCAMMALAAACLASTATRGRAILIALCVAALSLLLMTKSRTVCGVCVAGLAIYLFLNVPWSRRLSAISIAASIICLVAYFGALLGAEVETHAANVVAIGRLEESGQFSGRFPLWGELLPFVEEHPILGHGFQTFWDPERIANFSHAAQWTVTDGHSAYFDATLDLGFVGVALLVAVILAGVFAAGGRYAASCCTGDLFVLALITARSFTSLSESPLLVPTNFVAFIMICGLMQIGVFSQKAAGFGEASEFDRY